MTSGPGMTSEKIDKILASEEELIPSSGFLSSVMERIHEEAAAPEPFPFPWKRAVPGMVLVGVVFGGGVVELVRHGIPAGGVSLAFLHSGAVTHLHAGAAMGRPLESAGWVALALGVSWLSWLLSKKMAGRSS
jgi:hypothetical protein